MDQRRFDLAVGEHQFALLPGTDIVRLGAQFEDAVRTGGRMVEIPDSSSRLVQVLV